METGKNVKVKTTMQFNAPVQDLWEAITNPSRFKKWYFHIPHFTTSVGESFEFYESEARKYLHHCKVLELEPGKKFVHSWEHPEQSEGSSVVTWIVQAIDDQHSELTLIHEGVESFADAGPNFTPENFQMGWDAFIKNSLRNYLHLIEKLHFSININAPKEKVWKTMWDKENYKIWTSPFCEGSYYEGDLAQDARIHFLTLDGSGMYSDVMFFKEHSLIVFRHVGNLKGCAEQEIDDESRPWTGCFEVYRLVEINANTTELEVEVDVTDSNIESMKKKFPLGLEKLKELSEK